jgi:hypothetical protein
MIMQLSFSLTSPLNILKSDNLLRQWLALFGDFASIQKYFHNMLLNKTLHDLSPLKYRSDIGGMP